MVNFGALAAEIGSLVCGTPANFNGFRPTSASCQRRVTARHGTLVVGLRQVPPTTNFWRFDKFCGLYRGGAYIMRNAN